MRKLIFLFTLFITQFTLQAQPPVQVTPQLLAPYTTQISDYYSAVGNPKLSLLLLNKDFNRPTLSVRLRMTIEGQGVRIKTREDVNFAPITILSGQPYYVSPAELAQYFNVNNIELSGITQQEYIQTGKLPEGFYTYCFETVETTTGQTVSNKGCTFAWINLNEPPFLNLPAKGESVIPSETPATQNVLFNWTPRHTASPGAAYTTTYIFTLVEVTDNSLAPEAAFVNGIVRHVDSTNNSTYIYDNTKPALLIGKKYAWQVRAKSKDGVVEIANFKNNGYSEVFWFLYKNNCPPVTGIADSLNGISGYRAIISWLGNPQHLGYKIVYREKNTPGAAWFNITTTGVQAALNDLKPATEYEYRVGTACEEGVFTFAGSRYFTTKDSTYTTVNVPNCGVDPNLVTPPNTNPLTTLAVGDTIRAGDFKVVVTASPTLPSGSNGTFSGGGYVPVSYLGNMKLAVVFTGIGISNINNEKRLVSGQIQTTYDPTEGGIESIDDYIDYYTGGQAGSLHTGLSQTDTTVGFPIQWPGGITMLQPFPPVGYDTITGQVGPVTIRIQPATPPGGQTISYTVSSLPKTIKDTTGNIYQVNANGTVTLVGQAGGDSVIRKMNKDLIDDDRAIVKFVDYNVPKVKYAFDEWKQVYTNSNTFNKEYERIKTKTDGKYYVSAKAIAPAAADYLKATLTKTDMSLKYDSVKFISGKGIIYNHKLLDSTTGGVYNYEINIIGGPENDAQEIYAVYPQTGAKNLNLGKVFVASYAIQTKRLVIVPVNGATADLDSIRHYLNKTYVKLCINWKVEEDVNFENSSWDSSPKDDKLQLDGSGLFGQLTEEMKDLNTAYKNSNREIDPKAIYLFVLKEGTANVNGATIYGDMPRGTQFGYLFTNNGNGKNLGKTVIHEIGHGLFALKHVFEYTGLTQGILTPSNAMDYPYGEFFTKMQWDLMHDPTVVFGLFEKDKNSLAYGGTFIPDHMRDKNGGSVSFISPNKKIVCIPKNIITYYHSFGIGEVSSLPLFPTGTLFGFLINEGVNGKDTVKYFAKFSGDKFRGYFKTVNNVEVPFVDYISKEKLKTPYVAYVGMPTQLGFTTFKLEGLDSYTYMTKDDAPSTIIDILDLSQATLGTTDWSYREDNVFSYANKPGRNSVVIDVSSRGYNPYFANGYATIKDEDRNTQYLLVSKIMEYRMVYPDVYDRMTNNFNDWTGFNVGLATVHSSLNLTNPLLAFLSANIEFLKTGGYFEYYLKANDLVQKSPQEKLQLFLIEFQKLIAQQKVMYAATIQVIEANNFCPTETSINSLINDDLVNAIKSMSTDDLSKICSDSRARLIVKLLEGNSLSIVNDPLENAIYKLMWTCKPGNDRALFLYKLSVVKNSQNKYILGDLIKSVDDKTVFIGQDFNTMIMNFILVAYKDLINWDVTFTNNLIKPITNLNVSNIANLTPEQQDDLAYRTVSYNYVSVTKRLFKFALASLNPSFVFTPYANDVKSVATFNSDIGKITYENKTVNCFVTINTSLSKQFDPLEPIILDDKGKLLNIYETKESGYFMPAILLSFLEAKADARTVVESIQTVADVVGLAIPGGQAGLALKLLNYADKLSSVSSLIGSATAVDYPQFSKYANLTSSILGLTNLGANVAIGAYKQANKLSVGIARITANAPPPNLPSLLSAGGHEEALNVLCSKIENVDAVGPGITPDGDLIGIMLETNIPTTSSPIKGTKGLLIATMQLEKEAAEASGKVLIAQRLTAAINKLKNATNGVRQYATLRLQNVMDALNNTKDAAGNFIIKIYKKPDGKIFVKPNSTLPADQLAHIDDGELILDKIDNLTTLGPNAKFVSSVDNADYYKNGISTKKTDDLLFFEDQGIIKCVDGVNCFAKNTLILTSKGLKEIKEIKTGDTVYSYNDINKSKVWSKVTNVFNKAVQKLYKVFVANDTIYATPEHPFYTSKGWLQASALSIGMLLQTTNSFATLSNIKAVDTSAIVYNFTVEGTHTYYVGSTNLLVHNTCQKHIGDLLKSLGNKSTDFLNDFANSPIILDKFINGQLSIKAWEIAAKHADNIRLDPNFLSKLSAHLDEFPNLKADLDDIDVFKGYKEFANDKVMAYEILSNVDGNLAALAAQKVANSTSPSFWKYLVKGKKFEKDFLLPRFKNRLSAEYISLKNKAASFFNNIDLDQYDMYSQVQLKLPSSVILPSGRVIDYFVADQVYIKWGKKADGVTDEIKDMVIVENKLSLGTNLTPPQNAGKTAGSLVVRSQNATLESAVTGKALPKDLEITTNNKWLKAYDSENGDALTEIIKL